MDSGAWEEKDSVDDGFSAIVSESGDAKDNLVSMAAINPLYVERVLALCAGQIENADNWYDVLNLDSCKIETSEVIQRITFCQDTDPQACEFRLTRLRRCGNLLNILADIGQLPEALADLKAGFELVGSGPGKI